MFIKKLFLGFLVGTLALSRQIAPAQGFVNLGFAHTTLTGFLVNDYTGYYATNATVPGWDWAPYQTFGFGDPYTTVTLNNIALDSAAVTLHGANDYTPALIGKYSIMLQGGSRYAYGNSYSAIWQTGQIPSTAISLIYWGGVLQVTFNGQQLSFSDISDTPHYTIWAADISVLAGQSGQLLFTAPWLTTAMLDNIQFSSSPVPEPSAFTLFSCGSVLIFLMTRLMAPSSTPVFPISPAKPTLPKASCGRESHTTA